LLSLTDSEHIEDLLMMATDDKSMEIGRIRNTTGIIIDTPASPSRSHDPIFFDFRGPQLRGEYRNFNEGRTAQKML
jgi:hypothetical protein